MLKPDSKRFNWTDESKFPPWAKPVLVAANVEGGDPAVKAEVAATAAPAAGQSIFQRFEALNVRK